jgi:hypothetical protein
VIVLGPFRRFSLLVLQYARMQSTVHSIKVLSSFSRPLLKIGVGFRLGLLGDVVFETIQGSRDSDSFGGAPAS